MDLSVSSNMASAPGDRRNKYHAITGLQRRVHGRITLVDGKPQQVRGKLESALRLQFPVEFGGCASRGRAFQGGDPGLLAQHGEEFDLHLKGDTHGQSAANLRRSEERRV